MGTYTLHVAMAALVGASFVAVSAYYTHRKTLGQLLEFARTLERRREENSDGQHRKRRAHHSRRKANRYYRRGSASPPDVTAISGGKDKCNGSLIPVDGIPPGLPSLHTSHSDRSGSAKRAGNCIRPTSPKSPVARASAFDSVEGSDEEMKHIHNIDSSYLHMNGPAGPNSGDHINPSGAECIWLPERSHSVSGDLHTVHPDPVTANILREEPQDETFARLRITPIGTD